MYSHKQRIEEGNVQFYVASAPISLQSCRRFLDQAEISVRLDVKARSDEAEFMGEVDVLLQRVEVRQHVGIAIFVGLGEDPAEAFGRPP